MKVAFGKVKITPKDMIGKAMAGYSRPDPCLGILDDVYAYGVLIEEMVLGNIKKKLLFISLDFLKIPLIVSDYIKEKITIVKCGSKNELDRFYRFYSEFGIPCFVIFDGDKDKENEEEQKRINNELFDIMGEAAIKDFPDGEVHKNYLGFEYDFNYALKEIGFKDAYNESNPKESPKGLRLFLKVKEQVDNSEVEIPAWITQLTEKIEDLPEEVQSILKKGESEDMEFSFQEEELPF